MGRIIGEYDHNGIVRWELAAAWPLICTGADGSVVELGDWPFPTPIRHLAGDTFPVALELEIFVKDFSRTES